MKRFWLNSMTAVYVGVVLALLAGMVFADDPVPVPEAAPEAAEEVAETAPEGPGAGDMIWTFLNSEVGITIVGFILVIVAGKVFTAKPQWKVYADKYRPQVVTAIKWAEKQIPDDHENKSVERFNAALKFLLSVNAKFNQDALKETITAVHAEMEKDGNV